VEVAEKLSASNNDAVGAKLEPTIAAPLTEVLENGRVNRPDRWMRNVPVGDIRGDSTLVHEPVTDPESRILKGADGFVQAYNAQVAGNATSSLIVGQWVTQEANDKPQMQPLVEVMQEQSGQKPAEVISDSGYGSDANLTLRTASVSVNQAGRIAMFDISDPERSALHPPHRRR